MKILTEMKRSVLIDQTNTILRARIEKMRYFQANYEAEAIVIVLSEEEQRLRL